MRRVLPWILLALVVLGAAHPLVTYGSGGDEEGAEGTRIPRYDAVFEVTDSGDLDVVETLEVDFPDEGKHGIFRFFDEVDPNAPRTRRTPDVTTVTRDGRAEPYSWSTTGGGRHHSLKVGDENVTLEPGVHTYVLRYTVDGVLTPADGEGARLRWDLVPGGWAQSIDFARLTVRLPEAPQDVSCEVVPSSNSRSACAVEGEGTSTLLLTVSGLDPRTRVTLDLGLPGATPAPDELPWSPRAAQVLGTHWPNTAFIGLGVLYAGWLGRHLASRTVEAPVDAPVQYAPPPGVGPHQALFVTHERVPESALVASLLHAAELGAVRIERFEDDDWAVEPLDDRVGLDPITRQVLVDLEVFRADGGLGATRHVRRWNVEDGNLLQTVRADADAATRAWALESGHLVKSGPGVLGAVGVTAGFVAYLVLVVVGVPGTALALIPGAYAALGLPMLFPGASTQRTDTGRRIWAHTEGFRQALSTPSSQQPFDFAGREELQPRYVPWAVAFGCAESWSLKFSDETGRQAPDPVWVVGSGVGAHHFTTSMVADFDSSLSSAVSAYESSQSSSDSSSGSSGGGGGGGGGSW